MTTNEFISLIKSHGAIVVPAGQIGIINTTNTILKDLRAAMLPSFLIDLYYNTFGITLGSACIFGPTEVNRGIKYPLPSIIDINKEIAGNKNLFGKTIFGRNDLFWFATDAMGNCFMLNNLNLAVLRKYDDPYRAMLDCLIVGKI